MKPIDLQGFEAKFRADPDPWRTFVAADERAKRRAILRALGPGRWARLWEPACGAGANSVALARRAWRLDATDGAPSAVALTAEALTGMAGARALTLAVPDRPPRTTYDAIVVAEVLYYLSPAVLQAFARGVLRVLRPGGRLVLAHHLATFYDFALPAPGIHRRFLSATGARWRPGPSTLTRRWRVRALNRLKPMGGGRCSDVLANEL